MAALTKLTAVHRQAMVLRLQGLTYPQIAQDINRTEGTIANWFCDPLFRAEFDDLCAERRDRALARVFDAAPEAADVMQRLLRGKPGMVVYMAAKDILDRVGLKPPDKVEQTGKGGAPVQHEHTHHIDYGTLTDEELDVLERIAARARPGGDQAGESAP